MCPWGLSLMFETCRVVKFFELVRGSLQTKPGHLFSRSENWLPERHMHCFSACAQVQLYKFEPYSRLLERLLYLHFIGLTLIKSIAIAKHPLTIKYVFRISNCNEDCWFLNRFSTPTINPDSIIVIIRTTTHPFWKNVTSFVSRPFWWQQRLLEMFKAKNIIRSACLIIINSPPVTVQIFMIINIRVTILQVLPGSLL